MGCLLPMLISAFLLFTTRTFGEASVFVSFTCLKKSNNTLVGSLKR